MMNLKRTKKKKQPCWCCELTQEKKKTKKKTPRRLKKIYGPSTESISPAVLVSTVPLVPLVLPVVLPVSPTLHQFTTYIFWEHIRKKMTQKPTGQRADARKKEVNFPNFPTQVFRDIFSNFKTSSSSIFFTLMDDEEIKNWFPNQRSFSDEGYAILTPPVSFFLSKTSSNLKLSFRYCVYSKNGSLADWLQTFAKRFDGI
jgi:hypothetical protein